MTTPGGADNVTIPDNLPAIFFPKSVGGTSTALSTVAGMDQASVVDALKQDKVLDNSAINDPMDAVYAGLRMAAGLPLAIIEAVVNGLAGGVDVFTAINDAIAGLSVAPAVVQGIDASKITSGVFGDSLVPSVGDLRDAAYQGYHGGSSTGHTAADVKAIFADIDSRLEALEGP